MSDITNGDELAVPHRHKRNFKCQVGRLESFISAQGIRLYYF